MLDDVAMRKNNVIACGEEIKVEIQDFSRVANYWGKGVAIGGPAKLLGDDNFGEIRMVYLVWDDNFGEIRMVYLVYHSSAKRSVL